MRGYAGLAKNAVHIGGSAYNKNGAEISGVFKSPTVYVSKYKYLYSKASCNCLNFTHYRIMGVAQ